MTVARAPGIRLLALGCASLLGLAMATAPATQETAPRPEVRPAPELAGGVAWLNVTRPLSLADLRGKVVLLDFCTASAINCLHVLPDLRELEAKYAPALVVIGVHTPRFPSEGATERIRQAVLRDGREHPVVNDRDLQLARAYGVRAWPTTVVIDADGDLIGGVEGEGHGEGVRLGHALSFPNNFWCLTSLERNPYVGADLCVCPMCLPDVSAGCVCPTS